MLGCTFFLLCLSLNSLVIQSACARLSFIMKSFSLFKIGIVSVFYFALALIAHGADAATLTMDEAAFQPVNEVVLPGISFSFTVGGADSADAQYGSYGSGDLLYITEPSLAGPTDGKLRITLAQPSPELSFGIALQSELPLDDAVSVALYSSGGLLVGHYLIDTQPLVLFSEAQFTYSGASFQFADIEFAQPGMFFALDNLHYAISAVPEPSSAGLMPVGSILMLIASRAKTIKRS